MGYLKCEVWWFTSNVILFTRRWVNEMSSLTLSFSEKIRLTSHVNHMLGSWLIWNVKSYCLPPFRRKARGHGIWLSVVRGAWRVMCGVWFRVCSRYLVSTTVTPPVFDQSFWNFTGVLIMVWRYACIFYRSLNYFFLYFFHIFNLEFFAWFWVCSGNLVSTTPPTV